MSRSRGTSFPKPGKPNFNYPSGEVIPFGPENPVGPSPEEPWGGSSAVGLGGEEDNQYFNFGTDDDQIVIDTRN